MNVALDVSSVIWDKTNFDANTALYYQLASEVVLFVDAFEKVDTKLIIRKELICEMLNSFPFEDAKKIQDLKPFRTNVYSFLSKKLLDVVEYDANELPELTTIPDILLSHYSGTTTTEYKYLICEMHTTTNHIVFCTFSAVWANGNLNTKCITKTKEHDTVIHSSIFNIESYINSLKKKFEHNPKHDRCKGRRVENGECISPLSCFDGKDTSKPQKLLGTSQQDPTGKKLYNYDDENETYVCFHPHETNKYHGFDLKLDEVPEVIRRIFHK